MIIITSKFRDTVIGEFYKQIRREGGRRIERMFT